MIRQNLECEDHFMYRPGDKREISLKDADGKLHEFGVILAVGQLHNRASEDVDFSMNGVALIDRSTGRIIADQIQSQATGMFGPSTRQVEMLDRICEMRLEAIASEFLHCEMIDDKTDIRHQIAKNGIGGAGDIPPVDRDRAIKGLMTMPMVSTRDGKRVLAWNISMNFDWDRLGHGGDREIDKRFDKRWLQEMKNDHSILDRACENAIAPYLRSDFAIFETPEMACTLETTGMNGERAVLRSFGGTNMEFTGYGDMRQRLSALDDSTLGNLWTAVHVLRSEFSREARADLVSSYLHDMREDYEATWSMDFEEEVVLV